jgi:hypothetical protein
MIFTNARWASGKVKMSGKSGVLTAPVSTLLLTYQAF